MGCIFVVEPPGPAVGQDAPGQAGVEHVEVDLPTGVPVGEGVAGLAAITLEGLVKGAVPVLGVAHSQGGGGVILMPLERLGGLAGLVGGEENVIGAAHPIGCGNARLHLEDMVQSL